MRWAMIGLFMMSVAVCGAQTRPRRAQQRARPEAAERMAEDKQAIEDLHQRDIRASMADDVNALAELWTADLVVLPPGHAAITGAAAFRSYLNEEKKKLTNVDILAYTQDWREVRVSGDFAFEWGYVNMRTRPAAGGQETAVTQKIMRVLQRQPDASWKVARAIWNQDSAPGQAPSKAPSDETR